MSHLGPTLRRRRRAARPWRRVVLSLAISLAVNLLVLREVKVDFLGMAGKEVRPVTLAPLSASQWDANRAIRDGSRPPPPGATAARPPAAEPKPQEPPEAKPKGQIVDVAPSQNHTPPKDSRFLAEQDNTVDKETRARVTRPGRAAPPQAKGAAQAKPPSPPPRMAGGDDGKPATHPPVSGGGSKPQPKQDKLALRMDPNGVGQPPDRKPPTPEEGLGAPQPGPGAGHEPGPEVGGLQGEKTEPGRPGRPGPKGDLSRLLPSAATYDRLAGGGSNDHLDGMDEGDGTALNTRAFKYATYFNRIKQAVGTQWDPDTALTARDPDGKLFAYKDRFTLVDVTLDQQGRLKNVMVEQSCGVDFLDRAATDAFRKAQPFDNPPRGLVNPSGEIQFSFGFYYYAASSSIRIFRAPTTP